MDSQELAKQINRAIIKWSQGIDKLVIAIDGYTVPEIAQQTRDTLTVNPDSSITSGDATWGNLGANGYYTVTP